MLRSRYRIGLRGWMTVFVTGIFGQIHSDISYRLMGENCFSSKYEVIQSRCYQNRRNQLVRAHSVFIDSFSEDWGEDG